jgi:CBS domain-containing protein
MTPNVVTIHPDQTIESAARLMTRYSISSVIVSENDEAVVYSPTRHHEDRGGGTEPEKGHRERIITPDIVSCDPSTPRRARSRPFKISEATEHIGTRCG